MKKFLIVASLLAVFTACNNDDESDSDVTPPTSNNNNNNGNNGGNNTTLNNSYVFSDDQIMCFPHTQNPVIGSNGILSVISKPCQKSSSKLDGYFKWNTRPAPGTYKVVGNIGRITVNLNDDEFSMVFYNHGQSTLYSVGGTVEISKNSNDSTTLDLNWTDIDMAYQHDSSVVQFSGNLKGL